MHFDGESMKPPNGEAIHSPSRVYTHCIVYLPDQQASHLPDARRLRKWCINEYQ
jgi:hypothetical protein